MRPGDLVRINWSDAENEIYIVIEVIDLDEVESSYLEPGDRAVRFLDSSGSIYETIYGESEVRSGFFEILSLSPIRPS
jgi:hypothetical protein